MQIKRQFLASALAVCSFACRGAAPAPPVENVHAGAMSDGGAVAPTRQLLHPAGKSVEFHGRPIDLVLSPDGRTAYVKSDSSLFVIDTRAGSVTEELKYPGKLGASLHGITRSRDGSRIYVTLAQSVLQEVNVAPDSALSLGRTMTIRGKKGGESYPNGIALSSDEKIAYVCLSANNSLGVVNLSTGKLIASIPTGLAPYAVAISPDGGTAYVSNWGGRRATSADKTAPSYGTPVVIDDRGIASTGSISVVDLAIGKQIAEIPTGLHPSDVVLNKSGGTLYVSNANSDTLSVIDTAKRAVVATISVRPDPKLPFGSAPNALALSGDGQTLAVANGGNNAVALIDTSTNSLRGFVPAAWYPGGLALHGNTLFIANVKGMGSLDPAQNGKFSTRYGTWGSVNYLSIPADRATLDRFSAQVKSDNLIAQALQSQLANHKSQVPPAPVPALVGEPSVFKHIIYIIKENRTYDQVLGDIGKGNSEPSLCIYGKDVTPNQHALANQFVLLDNYYCNGALSPDGHHWATEGYVVDYLEKSFGAWVRSYASTGDDPLAYSATGFIWDNVLEHGGTFRNYGEFRYDKFEPFAHGGAERTGLLRPPPSTQGSFKPHLGLPAIEPYTCPDFPGFTTEILDVERADIFIRELHAFEKSGKFPNLLIVYLPNNHTNGLKPDSRTPAAMVADNDLAVGKIVDALSHGRYWKDSCVFVTEDDPQDGFDHVDGHRSSCLVISPYTKRNAVVSDFYNQTSVLHTMELMLGLPPMNQLDSLAPTMSGCFNPKPDLAPFTVLANLIPLDQRNPAKTALQGRALDMANLSLALPLDEPDQADEDTLNRILWYAAKPNVPYPAQFAGDRAEKSDERKPLRD
jgi:YVTN family beta-propeller protein